MPLTLLNELGTERKRGAVWQKQLRKGRTSDKPAKPTGRLGASLRKMLVPVLAVFTGLVAGAVVI